MYQVLYRKYRPKNLSDMVGQKEIVRTLMNEFKSNHLNHAYLFCGPRGTGKTSVAKVLGKMVNCLNPDGTNPCEKCQNCEEFNNKQSNDIIEIDAASNNGVDEIRELKNKVNLVPTSGKYKVYIIDEVHMLTTSAFNALLKTLEEPPEGVIFVLATTEPRKIPATILSRCQRFNFKKISENQMKERLKYVIEKENINITEDALDLLIKFSDGGMRDALSLLDQLVAYSENKIDCDEVYSLSGTLDETAIFKLLMDVFSKNIKNCYDNLDFYVENGKNFYEIVDELIQFLKNVLIYANCSNFSFKEEQKNMYEKILSIADENHINKAVDILLDVRKEIKLTDNELLIFEMGLVKIFNLSSTENKVIANNDIIEDIVVEENNVDSKIKDYVNSLKKIRINNALALFNKKELLKFKQELSQISNSLGDAKYSSICSLLLDGELKVKGDKNLIFVYKDRSLSQMFNTKIDQIELMLNHVYGIDYKVMSLVDDEWNIIKKDFNDSIKNKINKYVVMPEPQKQMFAGKNLGNISQADNDIDGMFGEILEYK